MFCESAQFAHDGQLQQKTGNPDAIVDLQITLPAPDGREFELHDVCTQEGLPSQQVNHR